MGLYIQIRSKTNRQFERDGDKILKDVSKGPDRVVYGSDLKIRINERMSCFAN